MSIPVAIIDPVAERTASELPIASIALSGLGSTPSDGATSITGWLWQLHSKPPQSAAALTGATTPTPSLLNIDIAGTYLISLRVTDNLGRQSLGGIEPVQSLLPPYGFSFPAMSSMLAVRVRTEGGLVKVAYGERAWLEKGLWELVDKVDAHTSQISTIPTNGNIYVDNIYEFTSVAGVSVHHPLKANEITSRTVAGVNIRTEATASITVDSSNDLLLKAADSATLTTTGTGSSLTLDAPEGNILISTGGANGTVAIEGSGSNSAVTMQVAGDISLTAADVIGLNALNEVSIQAYGTSGDVAISATDDITITAADDITISTAGANGDIAISATGADGDISLSAPGATGNISLSAGNNIGATTTGTGASVTLTASGTGGTVVLEPNLYTTSTKPVFAPGIVQHQAYKVQGAGAGTISGALTVSRWNTGSEVSFDSLVCLTLQKLQETTLTLTMAITGGSTTVIGSCQNPSVDSPTSLYFFLRMRTSVRVVADQLMLIHTVCDISSETGVLHATEHSFIRKTLGSGEFDDATFSYALSGDHPEAFDFAVTACGYNSNISVL